MISRRLGPGYVPWLSAKDSPQEKRENKTQEKSVNVFSKVWLFVSSLGEGDLLRVANLRLRTVCFIVETLWILDPVGAFFQVYLCLYSEDPGEDHLVVESEDVFDL